MVIIFGFSYPNLITNLHAIYMHLPLLTTALVALGFTIVVGATVAGSITSSKPSGNGGIALLAILIIAGVLGIAFLDSSLTRLGLSIVLSLLVTALAVTVSRRANRLQREQPIPEIAISKVEVPSVAVKTSRPDIDKNLLAAMRSAVTVLELSSAAVLPTGPEGSVLSLKPLAIWPESASVDLTDNRLASEAQTKRQSLRAQRGNKTAIAIPLQDERNQPLANMLITIERGLNSAEELILNELASYLARLLADSSGYIRSSNLQEQSSLSSKVSASELSEQREFFQSVFQSMSEGVVIAGLDGLIQFANSGAVALLHSTERKLIGKHLLDLINPKKNWSLVDLRDDLLALLASGQPMMRETTIRMPLPRHYQMRVAPIRDAAKRVNGLIIVFADITRLKELDQAKNEVMSLVSHELRTPLTAIRGYSELLKETPDLPEGAEECVTTIHEAAERLARILTTFLDVSRLESGKQQIRTDPVRLNEIAREAVMLMRPVAEAKSIRLIEDLPQSAPVVAADRDLLAQVITNLISNAIKYSPENTTVTVSLDVDVHEQRLSVTDQGYGIPPEAREMIWEKFYRIERESDRDTVGTGLGLSFVREIVRKHGGDVSLNSEVGRGSTFSFVLPRL
ncbi:MAG TPA: ATP-binding protein [Blastocatellia bacterium]|nr:ATP-binding protein [Blastocatellia bacterium]